MSDIAIMLNVIHFLELAEARSQLLDTKKRYGLACFSVTAVSCYAPAFYWFPFIVLYYKTAVIADFV